MEYYVLDANVFFNMQAGFGLGEKTEEVVKNITRRANELKEKNKASFFMPPLVVDEFLSFFENKEQLFLKEFLSSIRIESPEKKDNLPVSLFYELIRDIRNRNFRGLTAGEEEIEKAGKTMMGKNDLSTKDFQIRVGEFKKKFRERYRQATRFGFLDSVADLDLLILAKEKNATLVTSDEGVITWGRLFGVREVLPSVLVEQLDGLLRQG